MSIRITCGIGALAMSAVLSITSTALSQTTYYVNGSCGDDSWTGLSPVCEAPNGPKATIQAGINAADHFDSVEVADGVYTGPGNKNIEFFQKEMSIRSSGGPDNCIIDCENDGFGFTFCTLPDDRPVTIEGFTIRNGRHEWAGGICITDADVDILNCIIENCFSDIGPGGISINAISTTPVIRLIQTTVRQNRSSGERGAGVRANQSSLEMINCHILDYHLLPNDRFLGEGGGIYTSAMTELRIMDCEIAGNRIEADHANGGGLLLDAASATLTRTALRDNVIRSVDPTFGADSSGGGLYVYYGASLVVEDCDFSGNAAGRGAGLSAERGSTVLDIRDSAFTANHGVSGGGIYAGTAHGVTEARFERVTLVQNTAFEGGGAFTAEGSFDWIASTFDGNRAARYGGGLYHIAGASVSNCAFLHNEGRLAGGGLFSETSTLQLNNCTLAANASSQGGGGAFISDAPGAAGSIINSIIWGNSPGSMVDRSERVTVSRSDVEGGWPGVGNLDVDPKFVDLLTGNYGLSASSPCIDAGDNDFVTTEVDLDGLPRRVDDPGMPDAGVGSIPIVDMGAYEFQGTSAGFVAVHPRPGVAGRDNQLQAAGATPGNVVYFVYGFATGSTGVPGCPGLTIDIANPRIAAHSTADANGYASKIISIPGAASGRAIILQAVDHAACAVSNAVGYRFP